MRAGCGGGGENVVADVRDDVGVRLGVVPGGGDGGDGGERSRDEGDDGVGVGFDGVGTTGPGPAGWGSGCVSLGILVWWWVGGLT